MSIPVPILVACGGLLLLFTVFLARMLSEASRTNSALRRLDSVLRAAHPEETGSRRLGLDPATLFTLHEKAAALAQPMRGWWRRIEDNMLSYPGPDGREGWYLGAPVREILPEES